MKYMNLEVQIKQRGIRKSVIARRLNVSEKTLQRKFTGVSPLFLEEATIIRDDFFPDLSLEYLFHKTTA